MRPLEEEQRAELRDPDQNAPRAPQRQIGPPDLRPAALEGHAALDHLAHCKPGLPRLLAQNRLKPRRRGGEDLETLLTHRTPPQLLSGPKYPGAGAARGAAGSAPSQPVQQRHRGPAIGWQTERLLHILNRRPRPRSENPVDLADIMAARAQLLL